MPLVISKLLMTGERGSCTTYRPVGSHGVRGQVELSVSWVRVKNEEALVRRVAGVPL